MAPEVATTPCPHCGKEYATNTRICPDDGAVIEHVPTLESQVGAVLDGKYRLDAFLSHGGMGAVYRATHVMLGKTIAVKLINPELGTSPEIVRRFQREARAATTLNHPNIVAVYDLGQTPEGTLYIAMEFVNGPSLKQLIERAHGIAPSRAVTLLRQVASALAVAHRHGIIHRDLKPHNIMLAQTDDGQEQVKLVDFGIAKTFDEATKLTSTGFPIGTPHYMSPEQAAGAVVDARSDLYSVGIILYEMLTGDVPFDATSTPAILIKHIKEPPPAPSFKVAGLPPVFDEIVLRSMQKDPADRFQSADEFAMALNQAAGALPLPDVTLPVGRKATSPPLATSSQDAPTRMASAAGAAAAGASAMPTPPRVPAARTTIPGGPPASPPLPSPAAAATPIPAAAVGSSVPPPIAAAPASKSSSFGVIAVLVLGIAAALGAAYYLNFGRSSVTGPASAPASTAAIPGPPPPLASPATSAATSDPAAASSTAPTNPSSDAKAPSAVPKSSEDAKSASVPPPPAAAAASPPPVNASPPPPAGSATANRPPPPTAPPPVAPSTSKPAASAAAVPPARGAATEPARRTPAPPPASSTPAPSAGSRAEQPPASSSSSAPAGAVAKRAEAPPQAAAGFPEKPAVYFRCAGPAEVCGPLRSAVDDALGSGGLTSVRRVNGADVDVAAQVEVLQERVDQQFGTTFATRIYSIVLSGETTKTGEVVSMPSVENLSFDPRFGAERAKERARLAADGVVERVKEFAAKKRR